MISWFKIDNKTKNILFWFLLFVLLIPIWGTKYFLTGDGPTHLYNSKVLLDFITLKNIDFYKGYYILNQNFEPNWFSHLSLAFLLSFLPGFLTEKIFLSIYLILFALAFKIILKRLNPENTFLVFLCFPFVYHYTFQMGFYNFSFSIVFFLFALEYWVNHSPDFHIKNILKFSGLLLLLYFTHPVGLFLSLLTIGFIILFQFIEILYQKKNMLLKNLKKKFYHVLQLSLAALPVIYLGIDYLLRKGLNPTSNPDSNNKLLLEFLKLTSITTLTNKETIPVIIIMLIIISLFVFSIHSKIVLKSFNKFDSLFIVFIICVLLYFLQPGAIAGAGILSIRLQIIPFIMIILWFANINFHSYIKKTVIILSSIIVILLIIIRLPIHISASNAVEEYLLAGDFIKDKSTVLPLSFSHNGKTKEGKQIADKIWLFMHAFDYMGTRKNLILFDNYEANTGYFPIIWREDKNPFKHISINEGMENQPPNVDVRNYHKKTKGNIDYIILWCLDQDYNNHPYTIILLQQLDSSFEKIYSSSDKCTILFKRKI